MNKIKKPILPPLKVQCFYDAWRSSKSILDRKCLKNFEIKYNPFRKEHVKKNNWDYWTEKAENQGKYICNNCLISLYKKEKYTFWEVITNQKKRNILRVYANSHILSP